MTLASRNVPAYGISVEQEPVGPYRTRPTLTLLLNAKRCPFECVFCDLWTHNHPQPTAPGSIAYQIAHAIEQTFPNGMPPQESWAIKLYNGGNFTDPLSVPDTDWPQIFELCRPFDRVIVENHATMCGERLLRFESGLEPQLEVAIGLETASVEVLSKQQKKMSLADFRRAADFLRDHAIDLRCFVMLQLPYGDPQQSVEDAVKAVMLADQAGAKSVSIIPTRDDTPAMKALIDRGDHTPPSLWQLESALQQSLTQIVDVDPQCVVLADMWDIENVAHCNECGELRRDNLRVMNSSQRAEPLVDCDVCGDPRK